MSYYTSKYSFSSASTVMNEEGIPVHRDEYNKVPKGIKVNATKQENKKEVSTK